jgi:hypothetical protein
VTELGRALKRATTLVREVTRPAVPIVGLVSDLMRPRTLLLAENVILRQQLLVLRRQVKHPKVSPVDRAVLVAASAVASTWRDSVLVVKPDTVLRWHRLAFERL